MDEQGETHGGAVRTSTGSKLVDQFFGISPPSKPSKPVTANGDAVACTLRIDEPGDDVMGKDYASSRCRMDKESSPEIIVDCLDSVENVTLKDATSEKELLGNGDTALVCGQTDSLGSRSHEDKRKSSSDIDMDFAVLELDSSHLNLDASKQKTSLRKKGSLARRKKPSRGNVTQLASGSPESMFQDCTDSKPVVSPTSDATEDDVFDKHLAAGSEQPSGTSSSVETIGVRKSAMPFKPSLIMPGLHDLSKSKLFNQERKKSGESPSSPTKSPLSPPPTVLPKPTTKGQKESQNKTIAAENCLLDNGSLGSGNMVSAGVVEELVITGDKDSALSSSELGKPARSDSESLSGPKFGRTDSWSSVSSPRRLSRGDSVSSMEGGEGGSTSTTPRRASIQGSAYGPIGFRPRRSSSIILDSNNKLVDNPALFSASQSPSTVTLTENSEVSVSAGLKSPLYKAPVWLSEMKAKTGAPPVGDSSPRLRSTSTESNESNPVAVSPPQSKNGLEGTGSEEGSSAEGASQKADPHASQKADPQDEERANWLKAAQERTARMAEQQNAKTEENGEEEEEDKQPPPPWAAELKKKSRPMVHPRLSSSFRDNNSKVAPFRKSSSFDRENGPVVSSDRDEYSPSWMKSSQIGKKAPIPLPKTSAKPSVNNDTNATSGSSENRMKAYETPRWKLELAEKKKKREAEMMPVVESSGEYKGSAAQNTTDSNAAPSVPQWKQQLSLRKKRSSVSDIVKEMDAAEAQEEKSGVDLAKQAEERRARLMRLGLLDQAQVGEES